MLTLAITILMVCAAIMGMYIGAILSLFTYAAVAAICEMKADGTFKKYLKTN